MLRFSIFMFILLITAVSSKPLDLSSEEFGFGRGRGSSEERNYGRGKLILKTKTTTNNSYLFQISAILVSAMGSLTVTVEFSFLCTEVENM
jgi:hypothetical protein